MSTCLEGAFLPRKAFVSRASLHPRKHLFSWGYLYGEHLQDRVSSYRTHSVADVYWPRFRWPERDADCPHLCGGHEFRVLLLFRQDRAGDVPGAASHARAASACVSDRRAVDPEDRDSNAEDVHHSDRFAECIRDRP